MAAVEKVCEFCKEEVQAWSPYFAINSLFVVMCQVGAVKMYPLYLRSINVACSLECAVECFKEELTKAIEAEEVEIEEPYFMISPPLIILHQVGAAKGIHIRISQIDTECGLESAVDCFRKELNQAIKAARNKNVVLEAARAGGAAI